MRRADLAIKHFAQFKRMSPHDPSLSSMHAGIAFAHVLAGQYYEAVTHAEQALSEGPTLLQALRTASGKLYARCGEWIRRKGNGAGASADSGLRISKSWRSRHPLQRPEDVAKYADGMRIAGLPE